MRSYRSRPVGPALFSLDDKSSDQEPEEEEVDPFGEDPRSGLNGWTPAPREDGVPRVGSDFYSQFDPEALARAARDEVKLKFKLKRDSDQFKRSIAELDRQFPGYRWTRQEYYTEAYGGAKVKRDFLGFGDVLGVRRRDNHVGAPFIAGQITTRPQIVPHIRKFTDPDTKSGDETPTVEKLLDFLSTGSRLVILGYYKELVPRAGGKGTKISPWLCQTVEVTVEVIEAAIKRKRPRR